MENFLSLLFLCLLTVDVNGQSTLRLMSYNIRHGAGLDGRSDFERIAEVIKREHPDVVALQEVDSVTRRTGGRDFLGNWGYLPECSICMHRLLPLRVENMESVCCVVRSHWSCGRYLYLEGKSLGCC